MRSLALIFLLFGCTEPEQRRYEWSIRCGLFDVDTRLVGAENDEEDLDYAIQSCKDVGGGVVEFKELTE